VLFRRICLDVLTRFMICLRGTLRRRRYGVGYGVGADTSIPPAMHLKDFHPAANKDAERDAIETSLLADPRFPLALSGAIILAAVVGARVTDEDAAPARLAGAWFRAEYTQITASGGNFSEFFKWSYKTRVHVKRVCHCFEAALAGIRRCRGGRRSTSARGMRRVCTLPVKSDKTCARTAVGRHLKALKWARQHRV